jgi:pSer/pThr/pTyr-binding forkhead associated (FHA) protein
MEVKLVVIGGKNQGREIPVTEPEFIVGRSEDCHLRPASDRVSRKHCAIRRQEGRVTVVDFKSTNHTYVNGEQVTAERELKNGDRLKIGALEFEVQLVVSVGGKTKPKVHTIQEAAARTIETTSGKEDDLDIAGWLEDQEEKDKEKKDGPTEPPSSSGASSLKDTQTTSHKLADTTTILMPSKKDTEQKAGDKKTQKGPSHLDRSKKPTSIDSQSAANDMLRQLFNRKK